MISPEVVESKVVESLILWWLVSSHTFVAITICKEAVILGNLVAFHILFFVKSELFETILLNLFGRRLLVIKFKSSTIAWCTLIRSTLIKLKIKSVILRHFLLSLRILRRCPSSKIKSKVILRCIISFLFRKFADSPLYLTIPRLKLAHIILILQAFVDLLSAIKLAAIGLIILEEVVWIFLEVIGLVILVEVVETLLLFRSLRLPLVFHLMTILRPELKIVLVFCIVFWLLILVVEIKTEIVLELRIFFFIVLRSCWCWHIEVEIVEALWLLLHSFKCLLLTSMSSTPKIIKAKLIRLFNLSIKLSRLLLKVNFCGTHLLAKFIRWWRICSKLELDL